MRMRYLSVCSGIEAVSVAWQPLGWQPAMFAKIDPFCCWLLRSRYRASRPLHMPSPQDAPSRKEAKQRAAAIRNIVALNGPRYKALGNSMAVPVMRWIRQRIEAVDAILRSRPGVGRQS